MMNILHKQFKANTYFATIYQLFIVLLFFQITRAIFYFYNQALFADSTTEDLLTAFAGGTRFDLTATLYFNALVILLRILPFEFVYNKLYVKITNWIYWVFNSIAFLCNMMDTPFYRFINMRTQAIHINEILSDANTADVLLGHFKSYWYAILGVIAFLALFVWISSFVKIEKTHKSFFKGKKNNIIAQIVLLLAIVTATVIGMRGHWYNGMPLAVSDAMLYATKNKNVAIVLNTPFSIIRTIGKNNSLAQLAYFSETESLKYINPLRTGKAGDLKKKNVVIIIIEGTGVSFYDSINTHSKQHKVWDYELTPFLNNLSKKSHTLTNAYANGRRSSAGITAVLGGFPANDPFVYMLSPYVYNDVDAIASLLGKEGYSSRFLCGCNQGSYAFGAMSKAFGYQGFIDRVEYVEEYGDINYDGSWGIFDHAMGEHFVKTIDALPEPFITSWFTLNTHGPCVIPDSYKGRYKSPDLSMEQTVEYMDEVMRDFFTEASKKPWFNNTIFVVTADHGSLMDDVFYNSTNTLYKIPLFIYTPDGSLPAATDNQVASQIDIAPTLLGLLNYNKPFVALGSDILDNSQPHFAINMVNGLYQIVEGDFLLQFDGEKNVAMFNHTSDPTLKSNIIESYPQEATILSNRIKAFLQQYTTRIISNKMAIDNLNK